jgi:hypothetical protein
MHTLSHLMLHVRHRALCLVQSTRMAMAAHAAVAVAAQAQASDDALPGRILVYDLRLLRHISLRLGLCSDWDIAIGFPVSCSPGSSFIFFWLFLVLPFCFYLFRCALP